MTQETAAVMMKVTWVVLAILIVLSCAIDNRLVVKNWSCSMAKKIHLYMKDRESMEIESKKILKKLLMATMKVFEFIGKI